MGKKLGTKTADRRDRLAPKAHWGQSLRERAESIIHTAEIMIIWHYSVRSGLAPRCLKVTQGHWDGLISIPEHLVRPYWLCSRLEADEAEAGAVGPTSGLFRFCRISFSVPLLEKKRVQP